MTTNLNRSQGKTRERHSDEATRRASRPPAQGRGQGRSADDIRETVKEAVGKGVSAVAGAVEGVAETMEETEIAQTAETAIHQVGGTVNKVVQATKEEADNLKQAFKGEGEGEAGDEDRQLERDDPTFAGSPRSKKPASTTGDTEATTSGSPLSYGTGDASEDAVREDDPSKAI